MAKSLNAIASQIMANCSSNGNLRIDLNREHVYDEICQKMAAIIRQWQLQGKNVDMVPFCTVLPRLDVECADITQGGLLDAEVYHPTSQVARSFGLPVAKCRYYVKLPETMLWGGATGIGKPAIDYLGPIDGTVKLDIYTGEDYRYAAHRRYTGNKPFAWVVENTAWLFSRTPLVWQELSARLVLADQRHMAEFGREYDIDKTPSPWPDDFTDELQKQLTNQYISMYGRHGAPLPSDGNLTPK